jgi:protein-disulfide isomerase
MTAPTRIERVLSAALTLATVVVAGVLVEGRLNPKGPPGPHRRVEFITDWRSLLQSAAVTLGDTVGAVEVAVFTDFECPFCRNMDSLLTELEARLPGKVTRSVIHFPLPSHQHAFAASVAFECAAQQGRAYEMHRVLYREQASIGKRSLSEFGAAAGLADSQRFEECLARKDPSPRIQAGLSLGRRLAISGTPVVMVNGWLIDPAFPSTIEGAVQAVLRGKSPTKLGGGP